MKTTNFPTSFNHQLFGQLRVVVTDNEKTMFNLTDVCRALDINNPRQVKSRLAERGVITADTPTRNQYGTTVMQAMTYIDEANLYRCIFQSRKAEAERFQAWVFEEVLPQIRQTGGYIPTRNARTGEALSEAEIVAVAGVAVGAEIVAVVVVEVIGAEAGDANFARISAEWVVPGADIWSTDFFGEVGALVGAMPGVS